jgi:hypothetical protein
MGAETRAGLSVKCPLLLSDFNQNWNLLKLSEKSVVSNLIKIH